MAQLQPLQPIPTDDRRLGRRRISSLTGSGTPPEYDRAPDLPRHPCGFDLLPEFLVAAPLDKIAVGDQHRLGECRAKRDSGIISVVRSVAELDDRRTASLLPHRRRFTKISQSYKST